MFVYTSRIILACLVYTFRSSQGHFFLCLLLLSKGGAEDQLRIIEGGKEMVALNFVIMRTSQAKTLVCRVCEKHSFFLSASLRFYPGVGSIGSTEVIQLLVRMHYDHPKYELFK